MNKKAARLIVRDRIRAHLQSIGSQAAQAQRLSIDNDNLCDLLDDLDNEVQEVIKLVDDARRHELEGGV